MASAEERLSQLQEEFSSFRQSSAEYERELETEISTLETTISTMKNESASLSHAFAMHKESSLQTITELRNSFTKQHSDSEKKDQMIRELQARIVMLENQVDHLENENRRNIHSSLSDDASGHSEGVSSADDTTIMSSMNASMDAAEMEKIVDRLVASESRCEELEAALERSKLGMARRQRGMYGVVESIKNVVTECKQLDSRTRSILRNRHLDDV
eukprot:ANDGO_00714.mRNA.1 hypothetical protein